MDFHFEEDILDTLLGGVSALDIPRLSISDLDKAHSFILSYGYDLSDPKDQNKVWSIYRRAVTLIQEKLLQDGEILPAILTDSNQLSDIGYLFIYASTADHDKNEMQKYACAILRVMHVIVHLRNDLSRTFLNEIQEQILKPVQRYISDDPISGGTFLKDSSGAKIKLYRFDVKPVKASDSSIIKLLAKPKLVALNLLDTVGYRFVTRNIYDAFRVVRFLVVNDIISFAHVIPDQSANTLYPVNIFIEIMNELEGKESKVSASEIEELFSSRLLAAEKRARYKEKENHFSGKDYRFIKFITRKLVTIESVKKKDDASLRFFYPYEIQIMDYATHINSISGPAAHDKYKDRQIHAARRRVFGLSKNTNLTEEEQ